MIRNLIWATENNVVALTLAARVLYNRDIVLSSAAGALMAVSTIVVAINVSMLKVK